MPRIAPADPAIAALLEAARRAGRGGTPRTVLLLHLSAIVAPRPHHARIARSILTSVAERLEGEVLRLQSGDVALLCRHVATMGAAQIDQIGPDGHGPEGLPSVLTRLFGTTAPADARLFSIWHLPIDAITLHARLIEGAVPEIAPEPPPAADPLELVSALLDFAAMPELMRRQTAVRLRPGGRGLEPSFREITVSIDALERRIAVCGQASADPFVFRHLTARLDSRVLTMLTRELDTPSGQTTPLGPADHSRLHINLALPGILSPAFDTLADICRGRAVQLGVELSYVEACAQPLVFAAARERLRDAGVALVLDGVSPGAMQLTRPGRLGADLVKLEWAPSLARLAGLARGRLQESLRDIGVHRVALHRAETEAALSWGLAQGITLFQGRHVDAMLGAGRITACRHSAQCALRQCIDRAAAIAIGGRIGCHDRALLDGVARHPASAATLPA